MAAHSCGAWEKSIFIAQGVMVLMKSCILPAHVVHLDGVAHLAINGYPMRVVSTTTGSRIPCELLWYYYLFFRFFEKDSLY